MVVPISLNPNFFPDNRGKKVSGRKDGQVNFEDFLLERMEPVDSSPESGRDQDERAQGRDRENDRDGSGMNTTDTDSQGGEYPAGPTPGRRIDLRA